METEPGDLGDLGEGGGEFRRGVVVEAGLEGVQNAGGIVALYRNDERKLEASFVLGIEGLESLVFFGGEPIESSPRLFLDRGRCHFDPTSQIRMGANQSMLSFWRHRLDNGDHLFVQVFQTGEGPMVPGGGGDRRRLFKDVSQRFCEFGFGELIEPSECQ